jgi:hypothetical protein
MNFDVIRVLSINIVDHRFQMAQFQGEGSRIRDLDLLILPSLFNEKECKKNDKFSEVLATKTEIAIRYLCNY